MCSVPGTHSFEAKNRAFFDGATDGETIIKVDFQVTLAALI